MSKYVDFISNNHFEDCVRHVLSAYGKAKELETSLDDAIKEGNIFKSDLFSNVVDPFKMRFDTIRTSIKDCIEGEILRQLNKSVEQRLGEFHQKLLGGVKGWVDLGIGDSKKVDLKNEEETIFIEMKNKHNTCNSSSLEQVRDNLEAITGDYHNAVAYWAYIIPTKSNKSGNDVWVKKKRNKIPAIRRIWGENVYELVTGDGSNLKRIHSALPKVINTVLAKNNTEAIPDIIERINKKLKPHYETIESALYKEVFVDHD